MEALWREARLTVNQVEERLPRIIRANRNWPRGLDCPGYGALD